MIKFNRLVFIFLIVSNCQSKGQLNVIGDLNIGLKEASAAEMTPKSDLIWTIQDSGNDTQLFGLNPRGQVLRALTITNAKNTDWEDLTSDNHGNLYIGDFGNNSKTRKTYQILKINYSDLKKSSARAELTVFHLPKHSRPKNFEAFFLYDSAFYLFSKASKASSMYQVPNRRGTQIAQFVCEFKFNGASNKITSADINEDGKVVLLNHDKLWQADNFTGDHFFSGQFKKLEFDHYSQKEGICFKNDTTVIITDETSGLTGGNIYEFNLNGAQY